MRTFDANIAKINILNHFIKTGLTVESFANILGISDRWFKSVIAPKSTYVFDVEVVKKACHFFAVDFNKFTSKVCEAPRNLREVLQKKHVRNTEYSKVLNDDPSLPFIIDNILIYDDEFAATSGMESKDIKKIIWKYYPKIELSNLSKTLQKSEYIHCEPHATKKKTNVYKVK